MKNIYWIGPRESDIDTIKEHFSGSITIYGSNCNGNNSFCKRKNIRINHNMHCPDVDEFLRSEIQNIIKHNTNAQFLFYDQSYAFKLGNDLLFRTIGLKSKSIFDTLTDKLRTRAIMQNATEVIPFMTINASMIDYDFLSNSYQTDRFVIQRVDSSGGNGTFLFDKDSFKRITLTDGYRYIASPYIEDGISVNTHVFITEDSYYIFPSSVQICKNVSDKILYYGADYICYDKFLKERNNDIALSSKRVCEVLQKFGYRGIAGIDWLVTSDKILFVEINARFQASTELLNRAMIQNGKISMQQLQILHFTGELTSYEGYRASVPFSNYAFTSDDITYSHLFLIEKSDEISVCQKDGFNYQPLSTVKNNPYLFRTIFKRNICSVSQGKLSLHPNLNTRQLHALFDNGISIDQTLLKIALINHGIRISQDSLDEISRKGRTPLPAVFNALDIKIYDDIYVNAPYGCAFTSISPFSIKRTANGTALYFDEKFLCNADVVLFPKELESRHTTSGIRFDSIMQFSTDRIRVNPSPICIYKKNKKACTFCNLPSANEPYSIDDVKEVIDACLRELDFRHFLIGGGTISENGGWDTITDICQYIRSLCDKDIYIMTVPPNDTSILKDLKNAGVTEVAYNLEIFNRDLARKIMPGKGIIPEERYKEAFIESVKLWGATGNVRSLVIYGFDSDIEFLNGIEQLCSWGVEPIISCFRPLDKTVLSLCMPPDTVKVMNIYKKSLNIVHKYNLDLGPDCLSCRNNTISNVK